MIRLCLVYSENLLELGISSAFCEKLVKERHKKTNFPESKRVSTLNFFIRTSVASTQLQEQASRDNVDKKVRRNSFLAL